MINRVGVIYCVMKSLTEILTQTNTRLREAGFARRTSGDEILWYKSTDYGEVWIYTMILSSNSWNANAEGKFQNAYNILKNDVQCNHLALNLDEVHIASEYNQQFSNFINDKFGITNTIEGILQPNSPILFIGATATPYKKLIEPRSDYPVYIVYPTPGDEYHGLKAILSSGRIIDRTTIWNTPEEIYDIINPILQTHKTFKIIVARINTKQKKIKQEILFHAAAKLLNIDVKTYSQKDKNLAKLNNCISSAPIKNHLMIIIKDGLGAGVTIDTVETIAAWIDTGYNNNEALVQSLGRLAGYQNDRRFAEFPIICDKTKVTEYVKRMDETANGAHGRIVNNEFFQNIKNSKYTEKLQWQTKHGESVNWQLFNKDDTTYTEFEWYKYSKNKKDKNGKLLRGGNILRHKMWDHTTKDLADIIYNGKLVRADDEVPLIIEPAFCYYNNGRDKPTDYRESYKLLEEKYPQLKNADNFAKDGKCKLVFYPTNLVLGVKSSIVKTPMSKTPMVGNNKPFSCFRSNEEPKNSNAFFWNQIPNKDILHECRSIADRIGISQQKYEGAIHAAAKTLDVFTENYTSRAIIAGELQSGKTTIQIILILALPFLYKKLIEKIKFSISV